MNRMTRWLRAGLCALVCTIAPLSGRAQTEVDKAMPVVMEEATVRGKVAVLETRWDDRRIMEGLRVQVWSTKPLDPAKATESKRRRGPPPRDRDVMLHEVETDELGLFDLPALPVGEYLLNVSEVQFRLTVIPKAEARLGQSEPKVMLILIPKEVVIAGDKDEEGQE